MREDNENKVKEIVIEILDKEQKIIEKILKDINIDANFYMTYGL